jgi:hypothetical protein
MTATREPKGDVLLQVVFDLTETELTEYEWVEEGEPYREWLIPAIVNAKGKVRVVDDEDSLPSRFRLPDP